MNKLQFFCLDFLSGNVPQEIFCDLLEEEGLAYLKSCLNPLSENNLRILFEKIFSYKRFQKLSLPIFAERVKDKDRRFLNWLYSKFVLSSSLKNKFKAYLLYVLKEGKKPYPLYAVNFGNPLRLSDYKEWHEDLRKTAAIIGEDAFMWSNFLVLNWG